MDETRDYPRIPREVRVEAIKLEYPLNAAVGELAVSRNIAQDGICFLAEKEYNPGDVVNLKIDLQGLRRHMKNVSTLLDDSLFMAPLSVVARIVWSRPAAEGFEVGASFEDVNSEEHKALNLYLDSLVDA